MINEEYRNKKSDIAPEDQMPVIVSIPNNTVSMEVNVDIINEDNEIASATMKMSLPEIIEARIGAEYWEDENVKYVLTDKAKAEMGL